MEKIKIAFDLDGVIIDKPPLVPKKVIERLFRGKDKNSLHYRFPHSEIEQLIRKLSHFYLFRPPIKKNIDFIKNLSQDNKYELFVVSARYLFLKKETEKWLDKNHLNHFFKGVYLNFDNEQPHLFKEKTLIKIKAEIFVDDDGRLADYLAEKNIAKIFCFKENGRCKAAKQIKNLKELVQ